MAYFDTAIRIPGAAGNSIFAQFSAALQRNRVYRQTYAELSSLGERELDDLGIAPGDIDAIAREAAGYR